ncbi:murein biosynthesis integral membrane protein MurJ [Coprothermobacter platensis]|uniref:murein biosynthesis integral membrane protein MurJ n=1 Tax=Coprothermobacter platensis TaxID=108819 RepID=UPI001FE22527|nr:murein biosynthesis integral membrane protein MurJ [Coprothermobacter platensis]
MENEKAKTQPSLRKATGQVTIAVFISRITGFLREIALASIYGLSGIRDAYNISQYIPNQLGSLLNASTSAGLIPLFMKLKHEKDEESAWTAANAILGTSALTLAVFSIVLSVVPQPFISLFAPGFLKESGSRFALAVYFLRFTAFSTLFIVMNGMLTGLSQTYKDFVPYMISAPIQNIIILIFILLAYFFFPQKSVLFLALGTMIGAAVFVLIPMVRILRKQPTYFKPFVDFKNPYVRDFLVLSFPILLGSSVQYINVLVDQIMASFLPVGSIAALNYGNQLMTMVVGIFAASISAAYYPYIIEDFNNGAYTDLNARVQKAFDLIQAIMIPSAVGLLILGFPLAKLLFQRGNFSIHDAQVTGKLVSGYGLGLFAAGLSMLYPRLYYTTGDTATPMKIASLGVVINVLLNYILAFPLKMGAFGLSISTSITIFVNVALYHYLLRGKIPHLSLRPCLTPMVKSVIASLLMGVITYTMYKALPLRDLYTVLNVFISIAVYAALMVIFKHPVVNDLIKREI